MSRFKNIFSILTLSALMFAAASCNNDVFVPHDDIDADARITLSNESPSALEIYTIENLKMIRVSHPKCRQVVLRDQGIVVSDTESDVAELEPDADRRLELLAPGCSGTLDFNTAGRIEAYASNNLYDSHFAVTIELIYELRTRTITIDILPGEQYRVNYVGFDAFSDENKIYIDEKLSGTGTMTNNGDKPVTIDIRPYDGLQTAAQLFFDDNCDRMMDKATAPAVEIISAINDEYFSEDGRTIDFSNKLQRIAPFQAETAVRRTLEPHSKVRVNIFITWALVNTRQEIHCTLPGSDRTEIFHATMKVRDPIDYRIEYETVD